MTTTSPIHKSLLAVLFVMSVGGCLSATNDERDHLEHQIPTHRPKTFSEGVHQLRPRLSRLSDTSSVRVADKTEQEVTELLDILNWLPMLAAESSLNRRDWEQVQSLSVDLLSAMSQRQQTTSHSWRTIAEQVDLTIRKLEAIIPVSE